MPPLKLLNIQTTITKCISVFSSYNICAGSRMDLIDCFFLLIMDHIILLLCMPSNISLDTTHCKFSFLNEIFCSLTNILEFCLRAPVSDLRTA